MNESNEGKKVNYGLVGFTRYEEEMDRRTDTVFPASTLLDNVENM